MNIRENLLYFQTKLPAGVKLLAISKTQSTEIITQAYSCGQRAFGENKAQELVSKHSTLPKDIEWHFVGHLQSNKVKIMLPFVELIHSVDSEKLLQVIDVESKKINKITECLLQFYIAIEETKFGFVLEEAESFLNSPAFRQLTNIHIRGVMGMASLTQNTEQQRLEFRKLKGIFERLKERYFAAQEDFTILSMGMSDDYSIAIEEGSTLVRIGSSLFGQRIYP